MLALRSRLKEMQEIGLIISTFFALKSEASQIFQFVVNHSNNAFPHRKVTFFRSERFFLILLKGMDESKG
jgi:hypothetical protein